MNTTPDEIAVLTKDIVTAHLKSNPVSAEKLPELILSVSAALRGSHFDAGQANAGQTESRQEQTSDASSEATPESQEPAAPQEPVAPQKPAVPINKSVTPDFIYCLEDGKPKKMLKRYLRAQFGLTPEEYRAKWGLPKDYPMVAPSYAKEKSSYAKHVGLGTPKLGRPDYRSTAPKKALASPVA